eukprot:364453-Chlamydomonas_euryale.AAC.7
MSQEQNRGACHMRHGASGRMPHATPCHPCVLHAWLVRTLPHPPSFCARAACRHAGMRLRQSAIPVLQSPIPALHSHIPALQAHIPTLHSHIPALESHIPALQSHIPAP